jgi:hypothetical protein
MSVAELKIALAALSNGRIEDNEGETAKGVGNVYEKPTDRKPGTLDARWGDHPATSANGDAAVYGLAALQAAHDGRQGMAERLFSSPATSGPSEQALMRQLLEHANEGHPHSIMLQRGKSEKTASDASKTLIDQVMKVVGRR